jgi:hypothetical protein
MVVSFPNDCHAPPPRLGAVHGRQQRMQRCVSSSRAFRRCSGGVMRAVGFEAGVACVEFREVFGVC